MNTQLPYVGSKKAFIVHVKNDCISVTDIVPIEVSELKKVCSNPINKCN